MRVGLVQLNSGDRPADNLPVTESLIRRAAGLGAEFVATPEVTNIVSTSRAHQAKVLRTEADDETLARLRIVARALGIWLLIGSLALKSGGRDARFVNRSLLVGPEGDIVARYDKIHMFDVALSRAETYRESAAYRPGDRLVLADTPIGGIGLSVCYDLRFPRLFSELARAGAGILTVPSAFSQLTGAAHWEILLRARAIETGCFVLAPAQCGRHDIAVGKPRDTYGHSLAVDPWGKVLADGGTEPGVLMVDLDPGEVARARQRIPALEHARPYRGVK